MKNSLKMKETMIIMITKIICRFKNIIYLLLQIYQDKKIQVSVKKIVL